MCEPVIMMAATTALAAYSSYKQSESAKDNAEYQSAVQRNNTIIAERKAEDATSRGERLARQQKLKGKHLASKQMVSLAAQGVDVTDGTSIDLLSDTAAASKMEEQIIRNNAEREAYSHRVSANNSSAQAGLFDMQASSENPLLAGTTAGVSKASSFDSSWYSKGTT